MVAGHTQRDFARDDVDDLELLPLFVQERHGDRVERHELRHAPRERTEHVVERVGRSQEPRDLVHHGRAERPPVEVPDAAERLPELSRDARRQRARRERPPQEQERADAPSRRPERRPQRDRATARPAGRRDARELGPGDRRPHRGPQPRAELRGQAPDTRRHDDRRLARRRENQRARRRARLLHEPVQHAGEALLDRGGGREWAQEIGDPARCLHAGVRSLPGRLPVCAPSLITMLPFTMTCSMPTG